MKLVSFSKHVSTLQTKVKTSLSSVLYMEGNELIKELQERSPIDSGAFKSQWYLSRAGKSATGMSSLKIRNTSAYGIYLDEGAEKGGPPWYYPKSNAGDGATSPSGKLKVVNGRVWAGGLSPSGFVVGGISNSVILGNYKRQMILSNKLLDAIVGNL